MKKTKRKKTSSPALKKAKTPQRPALPEKRTKLKPAGDTPTVDMIFTNALEGIMNTDVKGTIVAVNPSFTAITGLSPQEVEGKKAFFLYSNAKNKESCDALDTALAQNGKWRGEIWIRQKQGENHPVLLSTVVKKNTRGATTGYLYLFTDVTHHIDCNEEVRNHAYYDTLTGLPNRRLLTDRLSFMINRSKRNGSFLGLLLLDLNRFHSVNDSLGYATGDQLLQSMATRLKACVREVDAVFRVGDDDFALILEGISQPEDASRIATRIIGSCATPFNLSNHELYVTLSIGICIYPTDGDSTELLLKNAQAALLRAKEFGVNHFQHYQPNMNAKMLEEFTLENDLRKALDGNQLIVYYQPQVDIITKKIIGAESLIRWNHPRLGMVSPGQFVHIAESNGLIVPMGEWVLTTACAQAKQWQEHFSRDFQIAVNLSNRQFQQQDLLSKVERTLKETGLDPRSLELEITESMGMKNPEATLKTLQQIKSMGVQIAIDDFGTGYSSIYYLKKFPIDTIKIDRSFVDDIVSDPNDAAIVLAMIALAHSLKLTVIAEGVENKEQLNYLLDNGCQKIQGFFYSPPVNAHAFEQLLADPTIIRNLVF